MSDNNFILKKFSRTIKKCREVIFTKENIKLDHLLEYVFFELDESSDSNMEGFLDSHPVYADLVESMTDACISHKFKQKEQILNWLNNAQFNFNQYRYRYKQEEVSD